MAAEPQQRCNECGKTGEVRTDNRGNKHCTFCWSTDVEPVAPKAKRGAGKKK